jgi:hypothetical protein
MKVTGTATQLEVRRVCYELLQILDPPYNASTAARHSAFSETYSQVIERVTSLQSISNNLLYIAWLGASRLQ